MVRIYCKNTGTFGEFPEGTMLLDMLETFPFEKTWPVVAAKVNNVPQGLKFRVYQNRDVEFLDYTSYSGRNVYCRSLCFLLVKAAQDLYPGCKISMLRPISKGSFCDVRMKDGTPIGDTEIAALTARMQSLVKQDIPFHRHDVKVEEAIDLFRRLGYDDKVKLLETCGDVYVKYYTLDGMADCFYGVLVPSTGYLKVWSLEPYQEGMLLRVPNRHKPDELAWFEHQPKTFEVFREALSWNRIMGLNNAGDVNLAIQRGEARELIQVSEALQEKKIVQIAEEINRRYNDPERPVRIVLITGPSSSGKTTVCRRLSIQLKACGLRPIHFSTDDYFVDRVKTPKLPDGSYDFDNFDTVDHDALQADVLRLLRGEQVSVPEFNFTTGIREYNGKTLQLRPKTVLLIEGIHALNPRLTDQVEESLKFRIFISTLTSISLDDHNFIPTSDNRLLRRIMRDFNKGAFTARQTISQWPNVRRAEVKWIYPFQETADVLFNSAYLVEFAVVRTQAERILATVPKNCPEYGEAYRLLQFLHFFNPVSDREIPRTSLLREFLA